MPLKSIQDCSDMIPAVPRYWYDFDTSQAGQFTQYAQCDQLHAGHLFVSGNHGADTRSTQGTSTVKW